MISSEPTINVGILERRSRVDGFLRETYVLGGKSFRGAFSVDRNGTKLRFNSSGDIVEGDELLLTPTGRIGAEIHDVVIGIQFHWERSETQLFRGHLKFVIDREGITVINGIGLEEYLASVISSEMSATSPEELLKAHAITSRSWLVAALEAAAQRKIQPQSASWTESGGRLIRWHDREDHALFDVCADDHCQRYQGISKIISNAARSAVDATRGTFLVHENAICDARYSKSCGGVSEGYEHVWENRRIPYLSSVSDAPKQFEPLQTEDDVRRWIASRPAAYCNTDDWKILRQILPSFDQETTDFFRWNVTYEQRELQELLVRKSGFEFGDIIDLIPLERGFSGRIVMLKIVGTKRTIEVGRELEIRKWLSPSHLYSSAFVVDKEGKGKIPSRFVLQGAGWGHGVGLCQIGAAVMATRNKSAEEIILHYFRGAELRKLY